MQNAANESGGAIVIDGNAEVSLSDRTFLRSNTAASGVGSTVHRISPSSRLVYTLPAPPGRWIESLPRSSTEPLREVSELNRDYPNPCAPGLVGYDGVDAGQSSAACSGSCPAGFECPGATTQPAPCEPGYFCVEGSPVAKREPT